MCLATAFDYAALLYPATDMLCCLLFILFMVYIRERISVVTRLVDGSNITAADYSVLVRGLPPTTDLESVLDHFNSLYNLEEDDWTFSGHCCCIGRKMRRRQKEMASRLKSAKVVMSPADHSQPLHHLATRLWGFATS